MVRKIFLTLDNEKFEKLLKIKGDKTWERLLVDDLLEKNNLQSASKTIISEQVRETEIPAQMISQKKRKGE